MPKKERVKGVDIVEKMIREECKYMRVQITNIGWKPLHPEKKSELDLSDSYVNVSFGDNVCQVFISEAQLHDLPSADEEEALGIRSSISEKLLECINKLKDDKKI